MAFKSLVIYTVIQDNLGNLKSETNFMDANKHAEATETRIKTSGHM